MKLIYCNSCRDIVKLSRTTRTCHCGESGGHYREDGLNAIYYGPATPLGFANSSFHEALESQPEFGMGIDYKAFVIPKVCPTMELVDSEDYESSGLVDYDELYDEMMIETEAEKYKKKIKIKNVFRDEE